MARLLMGILAAVIASSVVGCGPAGAPRDSTDERKTTTSTQGAPSGASDATEDMVSGARFAGQEAAKRVLVQLGLVPTSAKWPWETVDAREYEDGKDLPPRYLVIGTVEAGGTVSRWATIVMVDDGDVFGCAVSLDDQVVWSLPSYGAVVAGAKATSERQQLPVSPSANSEKPKPPPVVRTWTDSTGGYKVEAEFGGYAAGTVTLIKADGEKVKLPMERLSEADQEWIRDQAR